MKKEKGVIYTDYLGVYDKKLHEERLRLAEIDEFYEKGFKEGFKEGYEEGVYEAKVERAKKMLQDNLDFNIISKYTGLSIEELKKLKEVE